MRLESITPSQRKKDHFVVKLENGESFVCTAAEAADFALFGGRELTEEELERLRAAAALSRCKEHAAALLALRPMSAGELERKLVEKGESPENAAAAVERLAELGALDDESYARSVARHYAAKGWGPARVREELRRRFVPREYWEDAMAETDDEGETLDRHLLRRLKDPSDPAERRKAADALRRRGFGWEEIRDAIERIVDSQ
jgi:regulatory protein